MEPLAPAKPAYRHTGTFAVTLVLAGTLAYFTGTTLGLYFGGLLLSVLLVPYAVMAWDSPRHSLLAAACVTDAVATLWLWPVFTDPQIHLWAWLGAYGILLALALFQVALASLLRYIPLSRPSSAGITLLLILLWLTAPIWLFPHLQGPTLLPWIQRLINVHPLFALNAAMPLSIWSEAPIAYMLMNLNQDIPYAMPPSPLAAILLHGAAGIALCLIWVKAQPRPAR